MNQMLTCLKHFKYWSFILGMHEDLEYNHGSTSQKNNTFWAIL